MTPAEPAGNLAPEPVITYAVRVEWQPEEHYEDGSSGGACYMAVSDDIDGLVLQADSLDEMEREMRVVIPIMLELGQGMTPDEAGKISVRMLGDSNPQGVTEYEVKATPLEFTAQCH